ncbi:ATP-dependent DNA helicase [Trichonephila clavipes]|nr:ATP-dependent DNA helicase [Trichonephila clavipes]
MNKLNNDVIIMRVLDGEIVGALQGLFDQHNELVRLFKTAIQRMPVDVSTSQTRTVNGQLCATYRQACQELNLLENDAHWDTALADASNTARPQQIRTLFAIILTTCFPSNPKDLWGKYKDYMSEDILHRLRAANQNPDI